MFDEYLNPPPCVDPQVPSVIAPEPAVSTGTPSLTIIDQDAPSSSTFQTTQETSPLVIPLGVKEADHDIEVAHMDNNPYFDALLSSVEPNSYKEALMESYWIEAMQEELNEFEHVKVWEQVPRPDHVMIITLKLIGTDISQKDEKPIKKRQNKTRDGKVCEDEAQPKSSQLREEKAKKNIT
ncbi:hypothetical protein Tco_1424347 [Tanacetum coccineum]